MTGFLKASQNEYDPSGATWVNATTIGSAYEVELDTSREDHWRHRLRDPMTGQGCGPWVKGQKPND